jgi:hypothetical protein
MAPRPIHSVAFDDTDANWLKWGEIVNGWIFGTLNEPHNLGELEDIMLGYPYNMTGVMLAGVVAPNPDRTRPVNVTAYNNHTPGQPIKIHIPDSAMALSDKDWLAGEGNRTYPVPSFYSAMFGGQALVALTPAMLEEMRKRRVGEYVINECM